MKKKVKSQPKAHKKIKTSNPKLLHTVEPQHCFILLGGKSLHSLPQLVFEFDEMPEHVFMHHVNQERNDFANWIRHVIGEIELADKLLGVNTKKDAQLMLLKHLVKSK
jgi:hypothetical protein